MRVDGIDLKHAYSRRGEVGAYREAISENIWPHRFYLYTRFRERTRICLRRQMSRFRHTQRQYANGGEFAVNLFKITRIPGG